MSDLDFWGKRATTYNKLEWASQSYFLSEFVQAGKFSKDDIVLDVGTGTGFVAQAISPLVKQVIGIDYSPEMLLQANNYKNISYIQWDIRKPLFIANLFDKITARYTLHHILDNTQETVDRCYDLLKDKGMMIIAEGIPPSERCKQDFIDIFKLKEERLTFMEKDLINLFDFAGFNNVKSKIIYLRQMSVRNWLEGNNLSIETQHKIFDMHKNAKPYFKQDYKMIEVQDDCYIDMKVAIVTGLK